MRSKVCVVIWSDLFIELHTSKCFHNNNIHVCMYIAIFATGLGDEAASSDLSDFLEGTVAVCNTSV